MSALSIYNTLSKKKELFVSREKGHVRMYVCGPTVYDRLHVGNFRGAIFFNLVANWLRHLGYQVIYVYNYTDIDDKIIVRAQKEKVSTEALAEKYIRAFEEDIHQLKLQKHSYNPRATSFVSEMIQLVEKLIERKKAYVVKGEVFFDVSQFENYGQLSHKDPQKILAGVRVEINENKKNPLDFTLWKPSKPNEPHWSSPWGEGRPGWHLECSAMCQALLDGEVDIHGGGIDLIFPHHENEAAQSEGAHQAPFVRYWMHNQFIKIDNEKMSKSLGNICTAHDFMNDTHPEVLKYFILMSHYRNEIDLSLQSVHQVIVRLSRIYFALTEAQKLSKEQAKKLASPSFQTCLEKAKENIQDSMNDDFNTPEVFAAIFEVVRAFNALSQPEKRGESERFLSFITPLGALFSLFQEDPRALLDRFNEILLKERGVEKDLVENLVAERLQAREQKDYSKSDAIRDKLNKMGVDLLDSPSGTRWEAKR